MIPKSKLYEDFETIPRSTNVESNSHKDTSNEVQVYGTHEMNCEPDEAKICITISSKKAKLEDSKASVKRRYDYVMQCIRNHQCKDNDLSESSVSKKEDVQFVYSGIIWVTFSKFYKCQSLINLLEEKLDNSVSIKGPYFSHSKKHLNASRHQACMLALENAHSKASEIADTFNYKLVRPIWLHEEEMFEERADIGYAKEGRLFKLPSPIMQTQNPTCSEGDAGTQALREEWDTALASSTITMKARVSACFEMQPRVKKITSDHPVLKKRYND